MEQFYSQFLREKQFLCNFSPRTIKLFRWVFNRWDALIGDFPTKQNVKDWVIKLNSLVSSPSQSTLMGGPLTLFWGISIPILNNPFWKAIMRAVKRNNRPYYEHLARLLRGYREDAGLTQMQVADLIKRPQSFISKVESCERRIDVIELMELLTLYKCSLTQLEADLKKAPLNNNRKVQKGAVPRPD